jgi:hypothetical protein
MGSDVIPYPISDEEIWNSVDDRLAEELNSMGPYIGGYDERSVLFSLTSQAPTKVKIPVRSSTNIASGCTYLHDPSTDKIKFCFHADNQCQRCDSGICKDSASWILDSGASKHFSGELRDFASYQPLIQDETTVVQAASSTINIQGKGAVFIKHHMKMQGKIQQCIMRLYPVFYIPEIDHRLLSMGEFLQSGNLIHGSKEQIQIVDPDTKVPVLWARPEGDKDMIFQVCTHIMCTENQNGSMTIFVVDFKIWHKRLGHPSKQAIERMPEHILRFPRNLIIPKDIPICSGCAKGKMTSWSFPESSSRATRPFELIHSDLKKMPTLSYNKAK